MRRADRHTHRDANTAALLVAVAWMSVAFVLAGLALEAGLVATRAAAMIQWLVAGVLPAALALASLPDDDEERPRREA